MKSKLDKALSLVALGVLGVLHSAHAAPVYEIVNLDNYDLPLSDSFQGARNGYALGCLLYTSPSPRDGLLSRMPSSA